MTKKVSVYTLYDLRYTVILLSRDWRGFREKCAGVSRESRRDLTRVAQESRGTGQGAERQ